MFCPNCGHDNLASAAHCAACGTALNAAGAPPPPPPAPGPVYGSAPAYGNQGGYGQPADGPPPPNHLVWAIVSTVIATVLTMLGCCCLPLGLAPGITAIVFANKVNALHNAGDAAGAAAYSAKAKLWCWVTTGTAIVFGLWVVLTFVLQAAGIMDPDFLEEMKRQLEAQNG